MGVDADRFAGCLIGQCLGDALGFVVEGQAPAVCRLYVDGVLKGLAPLTKGRGPFPIGQYSDDSQLARELLQSYVARRGFDPADYARRVAAIFSEGRIVGRGRATEQAAERLAAGVPWDEAGTPAPSAGNGSAMRAGPVGLLYFDKPDALIAAAHDQGRITHADPRCSAGAIAIAGAVALALDDAPIDPARFLGELAAWCERIEPSFADWLISPFVVPSVLWSLYAFLRTPDDYWETVCTAIRVGGDVDTTAAMAGAIGGARLGLAALPAEFTRRLTDQGTWGYDELVALAKECYAIKMGGGETTP
jgi:ADP-ribosylglycohydrolase